MDSMLSMTFIKMSRKLNELYLKTKAKKEILGPHDTCVLFVREYGVLFHQASAQENLL